MSYQYERRRRGGWGCFTGALGGVVGVLLVVAASVPVDRVDPKTGHALTLLQLVLAQGAIAAVAIVALVVLLTVFITFARYASRRAEALEALAYSQPVQPPPSYPQPPTLVQADPVVVYVEQPRPYQPLPSSAAAAANALLAQAQEHNRYLQAQNQQLLQKVEDTEARWSEANRALVGLCRDAMDRIVVAYQLGPLDRKFIEEGVADGVRLVRSRQDNQLYLKTADNDWYPARQYLLTEGAVKAMVKYQEEVDRAEEATYREI